MVRSTTIYDQTKQRLQKYGVFSETTIESVAKFAKKQATYKTYHDFFKAAKIPEPVLFINEEAEGVPVIDIASQKTERGVIVIHLPMANPLDTNQLYAIATAVLTNPQYRVIAFGNPSGAPFSYKSQNLTFLKRIGIGTLFNIRPLVSAELSYLRDQEVTKVHHVGYSYGAHKALIETAYMKSNEVASVTLIDPVAHPRGVKQLIKDFKRTFPALGSYVDRTMIESYFKARENAAKTNHFQKALRRRINIAIGFMMARFNALPYLEKVLQKHPYLHVAVAWGSKSELGNDAYLSTRLTELSGEYSQRVQSLRLKGDFHAVANDIHVYAAIICESLANSK